MQFHDRSSFPVFLRDIKCVIFIPLAHPLCATVTHKWLMAHVDPALPEDPFQRANKSPRRYEVSLAARLHDPHIVMMKSVWPAPLPFILRRIGAPSCHTLCAQHDPIGWAGHRILMMRERERKRAPVSPTNGRHTTLPDTQMPLQKTRVCRPCWLFLSWITSLIFVWPRAGKVARF